MVKVAYSDRIICDRHFIEWLSKQKNKKEIIRYLMYIKASSEDHRRTHNLILESECEAILVKQHLKEEPLFKSFHKTEDPYFLSIHKDYITRNIIFAIDLTSKKPYNCYILTSSDKIDEYEKNPHYQKVKSVIVKSDEDAEYIINKFFNQYIRARDYERDFYKT